MSLIINIDTATETAHVSIARDGLVLKSLLNNSQKDHAAFLQPAMQELVSISGLSFKELDAVAVTAGPGSYTGLRVGMASAKGLCYALNIPFITIDTLHVLAASFSHTAGIDAATDLLCPMIDARRMEVFTALYKPDLTVIAAPGAIILDEHSFEALLLTNRIIFLGSGVDKWKAICTHPNASFISSYADPAAMAKLADEFYRQQRFTQLADSEPLYLKEFYNPTTL